MDKPKESKIRTRVMEILRNHDQEARVIEAQIAAEKEALEADLEFILESAYPSSQLSDAGVRVQSSPDPDGRLVRMVDKRTSLPSGSDRQPGTPTSTDHRGSKPGLYPGHPFEMRPSCPVLSLQVIRRSGRIPSSRKDNRLSTKRNRPEQAFRQG